MRKNGRALILFIFLVSGILIGALIAELTKDVTALSFLSYGKAFGISPDNPFVLDLTVLKLSFGFLIDINISMILGILISLFCYKKFV